ncbi:heat-inducible transcriptional repressor HrcA [Henriciella mobilis]|uniref:Heat-inducible transcription repressor HrcA n=1 Tax=Henriciella mobilis TaxID=2305467 RepID=A0A399R9K5_9PROT|nr:heat-inducible transcriptional repressor HrcA [Henriciella mobilis]RIJ14918.1 heat-inducible transcriptional repressor HrcA [Henriciella mobilis]RIJ21873.1 heat-inducible transcriptional repressor HrcA [Henriciella mobilis]RIJ26627.1 heat-inducible transcriptional repressor HrcA [Henriciella mobilis]
MSEDKPLSGLLQSLDERSRTIFREIVETYLETGEPVGSRTLSKSGISLSPASIRNVMADLTDMGLLDSPHISAGRMPTHVGLRLFVDGFLEIGQPSEDDRAEIEDRLRSGGRDLQGLLKEASSILSGLAGGAGLVSSPTRERPVRHVEFVPLATGEALCILVDEMGDVENRLVKVPPGLPATTLMEAGNYLAARMKGRTLREASQAVREEIQERRAQLDQAAASLVEQGLAEWGGEVPGEERALIVHGRANLLNDPGAAENMEQVRQLFDILERQQGLLDVLDSTREAEGVRLFIGSENRLFPLSGSSLIVAPYMNATRQVIGALGVIGPTRLNYARVIPMVDYTARIVGQILAERHKT